MSTGFVFEVTGANFQTAVVDGSRAQPVLLDFWAAWCGPCRTLGPVLEKLAGEYAGAFVLGKVDTEREQELAYAFQVQGIPFCVLVDGGRPVDAFQGALREADVRQFLQRNGIVPKAPAAPPPAAADPASPAGRLAAALEAVRAGDAAAALAALEAIPEDDDLHGDAERLRDGLAFLTAELRPDAPGAEGLLATAREQFRAGRIEAAMATILEATRADKTFRSGLGRRAMLLCFGVLGDADERCDSYRRQLATLLY